MKITITIECKDEKEGAKILRDIKPYFSAKFLADTDMLTKYQPVFNFDGLHCGGIKIES